jgi:flagellar biosynthetic protein FliQ
MSPEVALQLFGDAFFLVSMMVIIIIGPSLCVGLIVSVFQAATQINEQTLSFLPRLLVTMVTLMIAGPWLVQQILDLFTGLALQIPELIHQ